ncbi:cell surface protein [Bifidobacterium sp. 64T4]|uniref:cell surface protein n=1 Tax=Bifidobacterium pongonis TaxID=2834432 RepID=UPI001C572E80|nr:cell surface protein [Bifidobacterium pongonis]MBW3094420.1 cell surface protein [Bifidobacterium pongonis]
MAIRPWRYLSMLAAAVIAFVMMMGPSANAFAATLNYPPPGTNLPYRIDGMDVHIGAIRQLPDGRLAYCMKAGATSSSDYSTGRPVADNGNVRRIAWLANRYQNSRDAKTHAAIGVLVHRYMELDVQAWARHWAVISAQYPDLGAIADRLWSEAGVNLPMGLHVSSQMVEGKRSGWVDVLVKSDGRALAGVPYVVKLSGPARFDGGGQSVSGVSGDSAIRHTWHATGAGEVTVDTQYEVPSVMQLVSSQDYACYGSQSQVSGDGIVFKVRKDFTPGVTTVASKKIVDAGETVSDEVTSSVTGADSHWPDGLELQAKGYYFDSIRADELGDPLRPGDGENVETFLERIAKRGHKPAAYGSAAFTGPGQSVTVTAVTQPGGDAQYRTPTSGGIGTWVWAFDASEQSEKAREYVTKDVVSMFLEAQETNVNRSKVEVESTITEHSPSLGAQLSDTITVNGFPEDHGEFKGNEEFGIGADEEYAQVSVWWSGDRDDPGSDDEYRPSGAEVPREDEHHKLVGTWDVPARNGRIRVGAGALDAHGNPVNIVAEEHGWYAFVWTFPGDDRVMPAASAYDDQWEQARVVEEPEEDEPEEPEEPVDEVVEESEEPESPLASTGSDVAFAIVMAVMAFAAGLLILVMAHRRESL